MSIVALIVVGSILGVVGTLIYVGLVFSKGR